MHGTMGPMRLAEQTGMASFQTLQWTNILVKIFEGMRILQNLEGFHLYNDR